MSLIGIDNGTSSSQIFVLPSTQTPLFVAEWMTCAYPVSDLWASSPRYLYYALLIAVFLTQWHPWLANVFLGVVATYAGVASIEVFVLITHQKLDFSFESVSIPFIDSAEALRNSTFNVIPNLISGRDTVNLSPSAIDFDADAVIAITVTGYLMMLPMHCWSSAVRRNRARHFLILLWNVLMFAGMVCSIVLWPTLFDLPLQYRFCYPTLLDDTSMTSDGRYTDADTQYRGSWNETIWNIFSNFSVAANLPDNCFYPCYNTTQVMRRPNSLMGELGRSSSPRLKAQLVAAGIGSAMSYRSRALQLAGLMYAALIVTSVVMVVLLIFILTPLHRISRVPISRPKELFSKTGTELVHVLWREFSSGLRSIVGSLLAPLRSYQKMRSSTRRTILNRAAVVARFNMDILALILLFIAMVLTPVTMVVFVVFIEYYIHRDLVSSEAPQQVGQWSTSVSVALILLSAIVLRLRYHFASSDEIRTEVFEARTQLEHLEGMLREREVKEGVRRPSRVSNWETRMVHEMQQRLDESTRSSQTIPMTNLGKRASV